MSNNLRLWSTLAAGALCAISLSSCDPNYYYAGGGYYDSGSSSYGYGAGYGYGNPGFSTTFFVSTGNPRWGYDPYTYCYYDYTRRCYYDPYLYGYYPSGYRPHAVVGVPHPHGYRSNYCPPPVRVTNVNLRNYQNRSTAYQSTGHSWARQVRQQDYTPPRSFQNSSPDRFRSQPNYPQPGYRQNNSGWSSPPQQSPNRYQPNSTPNGFQQNHVRPSGGNNYRNPSGATQPGLPQNYRVPVDVPPSQPSPASRSWKPTGRQQIQSQQPQPSFVPSAPQPSPRSMPQPRIERQPPPENRQPSVAPQPAPSAPAAPSRQPVRRGFRSLGEG